MNPGKKSLVIAAAATGLLAMGAPAVGAAHPRPAAGDTPKLTVKMSGKNSLNVAGPRSFSAGRVDLTLVAGKGEQAFDVLRLHDGYTWAKLLSDVKTFNASQKQPKPTKAQLQALDRLVRNTTFYGGIDSGSGHKTVHASIMLPVATTYYLFSDTAGPNPNVAPVKLHVSGTPGGAALPAASVTQTGTTAKRFTGPVNLPASGTIAFHDASTESPHLLYLQHVKTGTTRKQVIRSFESNRPGPELPGNVGADVVGFGQTMTLTYSLPAGDYAELCFFPDPKTGMPHAFMGMVRIVHLS